MKNLTSIKTKTGLCLAAAFFLVPVSQPNDWQNFKFMNAKANRVSFRKEGLLIEVDNSASPLIYALDKPLPIKKIEVKAELKGSLPKIDGNILQGHGDNDDFVLRVGLIYQGKDRLNWLQRQLAPSWLVEMEKLLPAAMGIKEVHFYTTCLQESLLAKRTRHMLHSKFVQECVTHLTSPGEFFMSRDLDPKTPIVGLWIASDGDDMGHQFMLLIKEIKLTQQD